MPPMDWVWSEVSLVLKDLSSVVQIRLAPGLGAWTAACMVSSFDVVFHLHSEFEYSLEHSMVES